MAVVVTNAGEEYAVDKLLDKTGSITTRPEYVGWGTGGVAPAKANTDISVPINSDGATNTVLRQLAACSKTGAGATAKLQAVATLTSPSTSTVTNAGLFTAVSGGTLVVQGDHTGVALVVGDQIAYTFTIDPS
jgi:hypothetical protein